MKILQICIYYPPSIGGVENFVKELNKTILGLHPETEITTLCFKRGKEESLDSIVDGVRVVRLKPLATISSQPICFFLTAKIKNVIKNLRPDIIHFHYPNPLLSEALIKACKSLDYKPKIFVHWHGDIVGRWAIKFWYVHSSNRLLKLADKITSDTLNYARHSELLVGYMPKVEVVPAIPDYSTMVEDRFNESLFESIKQTAAGRKVVFSFGRMVKWKGFQYLIKSFSYLDDKKYLLLLGGYGKYEKNLKKQAKNVKNIIFVGKITPAIKYTYLKSCDAFVFPSYGRQEAFGISLAEAMYAGAPCITFDFEGLGAREIAVPNYSCLSAKPLDCQELASKIIDCCNMEQDKKETLISNARSLVDKKCSFGFYKAQVEKIYFK